MNTSRILLAAALVSGCGGSLSAQGLKTFKAGDPAKAADVNQNFAVVKAIADGAKSTADLATRDAGAANAGMNALKNRKDITGAHVVDNSLTAADMRPNIVSSIDGVRNDGGNIDFRGGSGIQITPSDAGNFISFSATPWNGGRISKGIRFEHRGTGSIYGFESYPTSTSTSATNFGLRTVAGSSSYNASSYGVYSVAHSRGGSARQAWGVLGYASNSTSASAAYGVFAQRGTSGSNHYSLFSSGRFVASGSKSFIHPHPKNPDKLVEFVCLEGNESGTYFRGTGRLRGGTAEIDIPEEWQLVTAKEKLTVHLTPIRSLARLAVWHKTRDKITVRGDEDCEFDYIVNGIRRGFEQHQPIKPNAGEFKPEVMGVPYGQEYDRAYRNLLVENGTLNPDYTPNLQTAMQKGWALRQPTAKELAEAHEREALWQQHQKPAEGGARKVR